MRFQAFFFPFKEQSCFTALLKMRVKYLKILPRITLLSFEWNLIRLGSPTHGIVTKTVHKNLPWVVGSAGGWLGV